MPSFVLLNQNTTFPQNDLDVPVGKKAYIKVKAPFCDKLSGMICTKFFGRDMVYM